MKHIGRSPDTFPTALVPSIAAVQNVFTRLELAEERWLCWGQREMGHGRLRQKNETHTSVLQLECIVFDLRSNRREMRRRDVVSEIEAALYRNCLVTGTRAMSTKRPWARCRWRLHERPATRSLVQQLACANIDHGSADKTLCHRTICEFFKFTPLCREPAASGHSRRHSHVSGI